MDETAIGIKLGRCTKHAHSKHTLKSEMYSNDVAQYSIIQCNRGAIEGELGLGKAPDGCSRRVLECLTDGESNTKRK